MKKYLIETYWTGPEKYFEQQKKTKETNEMNNRPLPMVVPNSKKIEDWGRALTEVKRLKEKGEHGFLCLILEQF
ncbi:hypothetical protein COS93_02770 [bacterium (Candidatus Gribaldobacteria) CG07_land_8_20_14_0_80_33_18]|uniref:Uncharacterized protein n=1 Tax=bacterium (Candidatus Gribaldobacteria) CG07_land_8_20_14_0_80_33_18 TaxID=2014272 RepID=A0A2M6Z1Q1_9BACT|nr:MAG: hypothetical protein COU04_00205 [bacterium (Candidatus Gribaldobacteria) CG10_big_fil_rev_8_21_14_0_10_33_41]PIU46334.1 MAG: hypothetical protein COS93_02770 [bacterium (Candidatus Gribaldobacteria) CG07_land_8_20_14_0_80_33_18]PJA00664.1 MAG: hypothetical protein COX75_01890 [bacterium (Candidatus Gribaldobacteria) CG_4_10_14_0_2_um_filter_33_15]PJB08140.1 MAG: hypothetical protein CO122_02520 [bacterium (Candidatus Gribaldobacteria) CG_4_9_14_3_um_filter_33_9]